MTRQCGEHLRGRTGCSLLFVNRTLSKVANLAVSCGGRALALDAFLAAPGRLDVIVTATSAREPLLGPAFFAALQGAAPLVIDLAVRATPTWTPLPPPVPSFRHRPFEGSG